MGGRIMYKYRNIVDLLKKEIYLGNYKPGSKLPSIQRLSKEMGLNNDTIVKAYKELVQEHIIYAVPKSGFYVVKNELGTSGGDSIIDMNNVYLPERINPYKDFQHCIEQAMTIYGQKLFEYGSPKGLPELIQVLPKHLLGLQVFAKAENIYITNGSQQALYILSAMQFPQGGTKVLVEQPTYSLMLRILENSRIPALGIRRTQNGIDLEQLKKLFRWGDIKFFYMMPRYHNPTGFSYSNTQKREILKLAEQYGVFIVEDDYLADLEVNQKAETLHTLGNKDRIVYIRSFSKTLLPGLRLGMVVLPEPLQKQFLDFKNSIDLNTSILTQASLEIFLRSNMYRFHVKRTKEYYKNKMSKLQEYCKKAQSCGTWHIPQTGLYAYLETGNISSLVLERSLLDSKVLVSSINQSYIKGFEHPEGLRLCVCNAEDQEIEKAVRIIKTKLV
jgi:DNA-binding transcriptional MocR family regulator